MMLGCKGLINKCMLKVAIFYNYYLFTNTIFYLADCSFNGCQKYFYEKLADTVLYCTPGYTSFPKDGISSEKNENLNALFHQYKRRFFERRSLKRPVTKKVRLSVTNMTSLLFWSTVMFKESLRLQSNFSTERL